MTGVYVGEDILGGLGLRISGGEARGEGGEFASRQGRQAAKGKSS